MQLGLKSLEAFRCEKTRKWKIRPGPFWVHLRHGGKSQDSRLATLEAEHFTTGWVKGTDWSTVFLSDFGTEIWAWLDVLNFWCLRCSSSEIKMEFSKNGIVAKRYNWHCAQFYQLSRWKLQFPITPHATITVACLDSDVHISLCKKSKQTKNTSEVSQHITNKFQNNHTIHHLTVPTFVFAQQKIHCQVVAQAFRNGEIQLLVTTDVMGRGLDIPGISHVGGLSELPKISQKNMGEE